MSPPKKDKVVIVIPSMKIGGMERVATILANYFVTVSQWNEVHLVILTRNDKMFAVSEKVVVHEPDFDYTAFSRAAFTFKSLLFLRRRMNKIRPNQVLSLGDRYNSFVILACLGLKTDVFISNRMNPYASVGKFIDMLNRFLYPLAKGIIVQTAIAGEVFRSKFRNQNVHVIGNPIASFTASGSDVIRQNVVLNVGRFSDEKRQELLIEYFSKVENENWKLVLVGDGPKLSKAKSAVEKFNMEDKVIFAGSVKNVEWFYKSSKIFAFTSTSEGFPNALGEALVTPIACISFNSVAGPSDLIVDGFNGFLVEELNADEYISKLQLLMRDEPLRARFEAEAANRIKQFSVDHIGSKFVDCLTGKA